MNCTEHTVYSTAHRLNNKLIHTGKTPEGECRFSRYDLKNNHKEIISPCFSSAAVSVMKVLLVLAIAVFTGKKSFIILLKINI